MGVAGWKGGQGLLGLFALQWFLLVFFRTILMCFFLVFFFLFFFLFWDKVNHSPAAIWSHDTAWADGNIVFCKALDNKNNAF